MLGKGTSMPSSANVVVDNPYPQAWGHTTSFATRSDKLVCVMVGLPARGKSYIARRLAQYLSFFYSTPCRVFDVVTYSRQHVDKAGRKCDENGTIEEPSQAAVEQTLADIRDWMHEGHKAKRRRTAGTSESTYVSGEFGAVAMYDATNLTMEHRSWLADQLKDIGAKLIFIETICSDEKRIWREISAQRPVVAEATSEEKIRILEAFGRSVSKLESAYEPVSEKKLSWIKVVDGSQIAMNEIRGFLPSRIAQFLMNLNLDRRPFYLSRHGQSEYNRLGKIGGDSDLTEHGEEYATALAKWVQSNIKVGPDGSPQAARLWTSSMRRTINTARHISHEQIDRPNGSDWIQMRPKRFRNLDEIYAGLCDGMTYEEIAAQFPDEAKARKTDKFEYRYPRGESYTDLISRLEPVAHEMERQREPLLIVAHQAILRVIYCYMMDRPRETCYEVAIPLNTVIKLTPTATGCLEERLDIIPKRAGVELDPASH